MTRASCLYDGMVRHRRFEPVEHGFRSRVQLLYLDLEELDRERLDREELGRRGIDRMGIGGTGLDHAGDGPADADPLFGGSRLWSVAGRTPVSFHREDHLGAAEEPLDRVVRRLVGERLGRQPDGPIRLLTSPRYLGLGFNPVSFYYCFAGDGEGLDVLVAEVTNTPWGERYCYVLDLPPTGNERTRPLRQRSGKHFHVSPFMEMGMQYDWRVGLPGESLTLSIRNELCGRAPGPLRAPGAPYFQADLALRRVELEPARLRRAFLRQPWLSGRVLLAIYWQAFRLLWKRVPYVPHPKQRWPRDLSDPALLDGAPHAAAEVSQA